MIKHDASCLRFCSQLLNRRTGHLAKTARNTGLFTSGPSFAGCIQQQVDGATQRIQMGLTLGSQALVRTRGDDRLKAGQR